MRKALLVVAAVMLSWLAAAPGAVQASWLSEALHAWLDRDDYGYYTYPPPAEYVAPAPVPYAPGYAAVPGYVYYGGPYYRYVPHRAWYGPREQWHDWDRWHHERHDRR
jgi:hypothetical protein